MQCLLFRSATGCLESSIDLQETEPAGPAGSSPLSTSATPPSTGPSFVLLDVDGSRCSAFFYQLTEQGELKVEKLTFLKE